MSSPLPHQPASAPAPRPVVLVTGGARRVGHAIAAELAAQGWDLAVHCHVADDEARQAVAELGSAHGVRAQLLEADLADEQACKALLPQAVDTFGRVDAVVNNASVFAWDDVASFSHEAMGRQWQVNTAAPVLLAGALHSHLEAEGGARPGVVVNLLDQKLWHLNPDHLSYTLSKAALQTATTMLAMALAPRIRVCGVAPGITLPSDVMVGEHFERAHKMTPLGRGSQPEDIARAVRFLLESPAITGTSLLVDGGQHLAGQQRDVVFLAAQAPAAPST